MRLFTCLVLLFIGLPAIEILCLVTIGLLPTLVLILGAGLLGAYLIRLEGLRALRQVQEALATGRNPSRQVLEGLAILVAGIALVFPGFFSDLVALFLLFGPTRRAAIAILLYIFPNLRPFAGEQSHSGSDFPPAPKASECIIDVTPQEVRDSTQQP